MDVGRRVPKGSRVSLPPAPVTVRLRDAQPDDRARLQSLLAAYLYEFDGQTEPYAYLDAYWTDRGRLPLLIENDGKVAGLCLIRRRSAAWSIAEFSVIPDQRRRGVGRAAVAELVERARKAGAAYLEANVRPDKRAALAFWLAAGFSVVGAPGTPVTVTRPRSGPSRHRGRRAGSQVG
jgi:ribosomal protein S18 acetylase RimI-like enzyme